MCILTGCLDSIIVQPPHSSRLILTIIIWVSSGFSSFLQLSRRWTSQAKFTFLIIQRVCAWWSCWTGVLSRVHSCITQVTTLTWLLKMTIVLIPVHSSHDHLQRVSYFNGKSSRWTFQWRSAVWECLQRVSAVSGLGHGHTLKIVQFTRMFPVAVMYFC